MHHVPRTSSLLLTCCSHSAACLPHAAPGGASGTASPSFDAQLQQQWQRLQLQHNLKSDAMDQLLKMSGMKVWLLVIPDEYPCGRGFLLDGELFGSCAGMLRW